jgi:hypothetical protein
MTKDNDKTKKTKLNDKQQYIQSQLQDLANKEKNLMFQLDQVKASQQVFQRAFVDSTKEIADKVL